MAVAANAAPFIPEGAVIECGLGNLPNAVLAALKGRKGLRMHSGAIPDAAAEAGLASCTGGILMGSRRLFDWARDNPAVALRSSEETHGAAVLGRLQRFVAVNSAVEVDFTGQVNGELAGGSYVGAVGGAWLAQELPATWLKRIFALVLAAVSVKLFLETTGSPTPS